MWLSCIMILVPLPARFPFPEPGDYDSWADG